MNWDRIEGGWKRFMGSAKVRWGGLTESRLAVVAGKREQEAGRIQEVEGDAQDVQKKKDLRDVQ